MRQRTKAEQREYVSWRAPELARTGEFADWLAIEHNLRFEEYCPEARDALDNERARAELDRLCDAAQSDA